MNRRSLNGAKIAKISGTGSTLGKCPQKYYLILQFKSVSEFMNIIFCTFIWPFKRISARSGTDHANRLLSSGTHGLFQDLLESQTPYNTFTDTVQQVRRKFRVKDGQNIVPSGRHGSSAIIREL